MGGVAQKGKVNLAGRHYTKLGYCDEIDIENFLLLEIDSSFSTQIEDWIAASEKQVNKYLGYTTASGVFREAITDEMSLSNVDGEGNLVLFPRKIPIVSVSKIELWKGSDNVSLTLTAGSDTRYNIPTSADYILYPGYELSLSGSSIINSFYDIKFSKFFSKVDYIAGYSEVPADIRMATVNFVSDIIMRHSNKEGLESITQGRMSKRWRSRSGRGETGESDFILDAKLLLNPYRIASRWV